MMNRLPAETFPPGEFLQDELEARGWSQIDLAEILGRPPRLISELIAGKRAITPETAKGLSEALGTSAQYWMNLESAYQLSRASVPDNTVARKAKLYADYPIREMVKRSWIEPSPSIEVLEQQVHRFFGSPSSGVATISHAAKKSDPVDSQVSASQLAWLYRAKHLAIALDARPYTAKALRGAEQSLRGLMHEPVEIRHVPRMLADAGVRFLVVEALPGTKIDGVCFWLDNKKPVIAVTTRMDRIDNFWFVLRHEIEHVLREDGLKTSEIIDASLDESASDASSLTAAEMAANSAAQQYCVSNEEMERFIARFKPLYSEKCIVQFANRLQVHPGIVVGQLHRRGEMHWKTLRKLLVKVREFITSSALTDGWGSIPQVAV